MKKCRITVMRKAFYKDLAEKYENPIEHACDLEEGQVFISNGWEKPDGMCQSAWDSMSAVVSDLDYHSYIVLDIDMKDIPMFTASQLGYKEP